MHRLCFSLIFAGVFFLGPAGESYANHQGLDCSVCHDGQATRNLSEIREYVEFPIDSGIFREVWFTAYQGWRSFADGDTTYDGVCEVCHTTTSYHRNDGGGTPGHFSGEDCRPCHAHENDFLPQGAGGDYPHDIHLTHPKGPQLGEGPDGCQTCHGPGPWDPDHWADGAPSLAATTVCDTCHSPGGAYDGVNDAVIGAKYNWNDPSTIYNEAGDALSMGKEDWCAGCHDDGTSVTNGVFAPNVMGDSVTYGYKVSGHGRLPADPIECHDCHDLTTSHIDGEARTYAASSDNYKEGYRLRDSMQIPRSNEVGSDAFQACFKTCHDYDKVLDASYPFNTYFRDDHEQQNKHKVHILDNASAPINWDSDWDGILDSNTSCTACHNIHGSPMEVDGTLYANPVMIRHGELISTPGTTDKVPAMDFVWYENDSETPTANFEQSRYGSLICGSTQPGPGLEVNHVCVGCHTAGLLTYYRSPSLTFPVIDKIRPRSCLPGEKIRITGSGLGDPSPFSALHVGPQTYRPYPTNPRIPLWSDTKIIVRIPFKNKPCEWFKQGDGEYRKRKVWVTVSEDSNLLESNTKKFKVLKPDTCP